MIAFIRECHRRMRLLTPTGQIPASGDDCPDHTLPCCGGKGCHHEAGCDKDPMYIAGQQYAMNREKHIFETVFGK